MDVGVHIQLLSDQWNGMRDHSVRTVVGNVVLQKSGLFEHVCGEADVHQISQFNKMAAMT